MDISRILPEPEELDCFSFKFESWFRWQRKYGWGSFISTACSTDYFSYEPMSVVSACQPSHPTFVSPQFWAANSLPTGSILFIIVVRI